MAKTKGLKEKLGELEKKVSYLETEDIPLEEAITDYSKALKLAENSFGQLKKIKQTVNDIDKNFDNSLSE